MLRKIHTKLSQMNDQLFNWFAVVLEKLVTSRAAQAVAKQFSIRRRRYTGHHRSDLKRKYTYTPIESTGTLLVQAPRRRRSPVAALRSHLPKSQAKEAALRLRNRGQVYVGRVSAAQVGLIAAIALLRQVDEICERAMHPYVT